MREKLAKELRKLEGEGCWVWQTQAHKNPGPHSIMSPKGRTPRVCTQVEQLDARIEETNEVSPKEQPRRAATLASIRKCSLWYRPRPTVVRRGNSKHEPFSGKPHDSNCVTAAENGEGGLTNKVLRRVAMTVKVRHVRERNIEKLRLIDSF
jgi:hypothetical protein